MHELNLRLSAYVKRERKRQKLTGAKIEELTSGAISTVTLSKLENGKTRWSLDHIAALAPTLGLNPGGLLANAAGSPRGNPSVRPELVPLLVAAEAEEWRTAVIELGELAKAGGGR